MFNTILVGYDGSDEAKDALALARDLSDAATSIVAVDVVEMNASAPSFGYGAWMNLLGRGAEAIIAELPDDVERHTVFAQSTPAALLKAAEAEGADAIVVGSAHMGCIGRVLAGSVGAALARRAACPLIVAPFAYRLRVDPSAPGQKIECAVPAP